MEEAVDVGERAEMGGACGSGDEVEWRGWNDGREG